MKGYPQMAVERADHPAVVHPGGAVTYRQLDERASRLAHVLRGLGVRPASASAVMLPNSIEFVECLAATAKLGVSALTLNWHLQADEVAWILDDSGAERAGHPRATCADVVEQVVADAPAAGRCGSATTTRSGWPPRPTSRFPTAGRRPWPVHLHLGHLGPTQGRRARRAWLIRPSWR